MFTYLKHIKNWNENLYISICCIASAVLLAVIFYFG